MKEISAKKKKKVFEGKTKVIYETDKEDYLIQEFKDDAPAFNGKKLGKIKAKGSVNNQISAYLFNYLENYHVPTHFIKQVSDVSMLVRKLEMIPLEVVMRNIATGSMVKRHGIKEGTELPRPTLEYYLKDEEKQDPVIDEDRIVSFGHATQDELQHIERSTKKVNAVLKDFFARRNLKLVDFKLEFGRNKSGKLYLADEISLDTCRFLDQDTNEKIDKDRQDSSKVEEAYKEVLSRVFHLS
ncbi:MAG: phosphoribosylaminoimidazolesuccinocarboxamide synthase [bacterium]